MRCTCLNTQEFFVCSLNRLSPVINRNGRKDGSYKEYINRDYINRKIIGSDELRKDCHKSLNIKKGVSYFPFDYTMCKFITDLFFTNVSLVLTVCLREADHSFQE